MIYREGSVSVEMVTTYNDQRIFKFTVGEKESFLLNRKEFLDLVIALKSLAQGILNQDVNTKYFDA